jgi:hypothetical protein
MNEEGILPPSQYYLALIAQGYKDFGLDISFLNDAVKHSKEHKNVTPLLKKRHFYSSYDDKKPEQNNRKLSKKERRMLRKQRARQIAQGTNHNTLPVPYSNYFYQHKPKNNYWKWMAEQQEKYENKQKDHETKTFEPVEGAAYGKIICSCGHALKYGTQCPHCEAYDFDKNLNDSLDNI